ncbi:MAG TPA: SLBB domain-containing protein [Gemmatimonadaceae bacterium]|nr:SLBB domain-containing protein [Gemmatimonadaceae bacterium]
MRICTRVPQLWLRRAGRLSSPLALAVSLALAPSLLTAQSPSVLTSRAELTAAAQQAESQAAISSGLVSTKNRLLAAAIRQRLDAGDFAVGDRIILSYISDIPHTDTLAVRSGPTLVLPANASLPLSGVLRSELRAKVETELLKYIKASEVEVTPLTRVGVLGEVARPGYFALRSDVPLADAIMIAGGPTATADVERSVIRRGDKEIHSADETRTAISRGLTLDQFGIGAGDEIVIARKRDMLGGSIMPIVGALASVAAIFVALHH